MDSPTDLIASPAADPVVERFLARFVSSLDDGGFAKLLLAKPQRAPDELQRVTARPVQLRGEPMLSLLYTHKTRDITKNFSFAEGVTTLRGLLGPVFRNAHLHTRDEDWQLTISKKGQGQLHLGPATQAADATTAHGRMAHDREKQRWLELTRPFLTELGVTTAQQQLIPAMSRKWKQINKFVEVFAHALAASPLAEAKEIHVADFGSGKGYLTFAVHDWLRHAKGVNAQVTGVELRPDMVALCNKAIAKLGIDGLRIEQGDVRSYQPAALNVMIALHACDVATDYAIHLGLRAGAEIIMCSPCCHKELRPQLLSPHPLRPILQHGVHLGQQAEMLTDGLRAMLLDACGYDTQVFEFISLEHTNKNKMILAVKRALPQANTEVLQQVREIKDFYRIQTQCLETLLQADGLLTP